MWNFAEVVRKVGEELTFLILKIIFLPKIISVTEGVKLLTFNDIEMCFLINWCLSSHCFSWLTGWHLTLGLSTCYACQVLCYHGELRLETVTASLTSELITVGSRLSFCDLTGDFQGGSKQSLHHSDLHWALTAFSPARREKADWAAFVSSEYKYMLRNNEPQL